MTLSYLEARCSLRIVESLAVALCVVHLAGCSYNRLF